MVLYVAHNGASPTTAAQVVVTTGTAIKTLLQVATPATREIRLLEWSISFDGSAAATPIKVELLQTDVAATVTSLTPTLYDSPLGPASLCVGGTAATGYTATAEGTIAATRVFAAELIAPTAGYTYQFVPGREPLIPVSKFVRIRVTAGAAVNAYCRLIWQE